MRSATPTLYTGFISSGFIFLGFGLFFSLSSGGGTLFTSIIISSVPAFLISILFICITPFSSVVNVCSSFSPIVKLNVAFDIFSFSSLLLLFTNSKL